jgi:tetrahydromethanopterin S-methyltransferase subunit F
LRNERLTRSRMEWLFVGFIAAMLMVMVLLAT